MSCMMKRLNPLEMMIWLLNWLNPTLKLLTGVRNTGPLKSDKLEALPNNYDNALQRTMSLRKTALCKSTLRQTLTDTFAELIHEKWIEPVNEPQPSEGGQPVWYLPFFVTKSDKPRIVYDGSATVKGNSLNQAVWVEKTC